MCLLVSLVIYLFLQLLLFGGRGDYLVSFVLFFFFFLFFTFLCRGKGYFNLLVGGVRDSSSAGQSMTYIYI